MGPEDALLHFGILCEKPGFGSASNDGLDAFKGLRLRISGNPKTSNLSCKSRLANANAITFSHGKTNA